MRHLLWASLALAACTHPRGAHPEPVAAPEGAVLPESPAAAAYAREASAQLAAARAGFAALEKVPAPATVATVLEPLNDLWIIVDAASSGAALTRSVHPDAAMRAAATRIEQEIAALTTDIGLSRPVYEAVAHIDLTGEDAVTQRYVAHVLRDFRRAGVDRDAPTRARVRALREALTRIGQQFDQNIREDVRHVTLRGADALRGLPADFIAAHPPNAAGEVVLSTDYPDYLPMMTYAEDDAARLALYRAFRMRGAPANGPVLQAMLDTRQELAHLLGAASWADYATADKMIGSAAAAQAFIDKIDAVARPRAEHDAQELLAALRERTPDATAVGDWQKAFLEEQVKRRHYAFDSQAARAYLPFGRVRDGVMDVAARMFGVAFRRVDVPVWHTDVVAYELLEHGEVVGRFYLDLHPRADKYKHAAAFPIRAGVAGRQLPEAALVCNFPAGETALLEHDDVQTFFHEFGHLLHHLFAGKQRWVGLSGIATEWDFVEAPSQMLEEWAFDPEVLGRFARNADGAPMGKELIAAMRAARDFGRGLWVRQQMFYAAASLQLHAQGAAAANVAAVMARVQARYSPFAAVPDTHFELSFGHLEGYSALYYTYMWSLVIAKDMFSAFARDGLMDVATARRYRTAVLAPGGSRDAHDLVHDFLGRDFSFASFAAWIDGH